MFVGAGDKVLLKIKLRLPGVMPQSDQDVRKAKRGGADREWIWDWRGRRRRRRFRRYYWKIGRIIFGVRDRFEIILYKNVSIDTRYPIWSWIWVGCSTILRSEQASSAKFPTAQALLGNKIQPVNNQTKVKEQMVHPVDLGRSGHKGLFYTYSTVNIQSKQEMK